MLVTLSLADGRLRLHAPPLVEDHPHSPAHTDSLRDVAHRYERATAPSRPDDLLDLGRELARWLDSTFSSALTRILKDVTPPLVLEIRVPRRFDEHARALLDAPWELLADERGHLVADRHVRLAPVRRLGLADPTPAPPRPGVLTVLFMAASPRGATELDFEAEEARILAATKGLALDLFVEETGTARELGVRAAALDGPEHSLHVVHVTCHGHNAPTPVMALEDERGELALASPETLHASLGELGSRLGLVFLSACSTAAFVSNNNPTDSLTLDLVRAGVPAALGWAAPVGDQSAILFASAFYDRLGRGESLENAVGEARRGLASDEHPNPNWHLSRLVLGPTGGGALATGKGERRRTGAIHKHFLGDDRRIPVAGPNEFVGRRRTLQACIRALREPDKLGVLIHGTGGLGKSSLAARVVDRMSDHLSVVLYGRFGHMEVIESLATAIGTDAAMWRDAWRSKDGKTSETGDAVRMLLASGLAKPLLLVLDDFEQQLEGQPDALHVVQPDAVERVRGLVHAFVHAGGRSRLMITSRFDFALVDQVGADLTGSLVRVSVPSFSEREEFKRLVRSRGVVADELLVRCGRVSYGNPALLSLLLKRAEQDPKGCEALLEQAEGQAKLTDSELTERVAHLAVESVIGALNGGERELFRLSLIFEVPVPLELARVLGKAADPVVDDDGTRLVALGAWDVFPDVANAERPAILANRMVAEWSLRSGMKVPSKVRQDAVARVLVPELRRAWASIRKRVGDDASRRAGDWVYGLAWHCGETVIAEEFARLAVAQHALTNTPEQARRFASAVVEGFGGVNAIGDAELLREVAGLHERGDAGEFWMACLERALVRSSELSAGVRGTVHFDLAIARIRQGRLDDALEQLQHAGKMFDETNDIRSRAVALGKVADILQTRGQLGEALHILQEKMLPIFEQIGDARSRAVTLGQVADILQARGQLDESLRILREELLSVYNRLGDVRSRAVTLGKVADILQTRGQLDEALHIHYREELPVYEWLGDVRSRAVTLGKVADILQTRGQLEEALHIRLGEQLPVFERLGDVRSRAVTLGKVADILQARGQLEEALHIHYSEELPVYERLGDVRSRAVTLGKVADILQTRRQLDDALHIRQQQLDVYERLGDIRERAVTLGKVADILQTRGQLDEALRIRREEQLPVFERIGDVRSRAVTLGKVADILQARGQLDEALRIRREEQLPVFEHLGDIRSRAVALGKVADILQARGQLEEALRIRREEQLPVFERLRDVHSLVVERVNLAIVLAQRGLREDVREAVVLLSNSLADARQLQLAEVGQIEALIRQLGVDPNSVTAASRAGAGSSSLVISKSTSQDAFEGFKHRDSEKGTRAS